MAPMLPDGFTLTIEDKPAEADREVLPNTLEAFNERAWPRHQPWQELGVFIREQGKVVGGLYGGTYGGWLFIRYFVLPEALRRQGVGRKVIAEAERVARERGSHSAWVDTFSFQAPGFYQKQGYVEFGRIEIPPAGHRIFLQKKL